MVLTYHKVINYSAIISNEFSRAKDCQTLGQTHFNLCHLTIVILLVGSCKSCGNLTVTSPISMLINLIECLLHPLSCGMILRQALLLKNVVDKRTRNRINFKLITSHDGQNERENFPPIIKIDLKKLKSHQVVKRGLELTFVINLQLR